MNDNPKDKIEFLLGEMYQKLESIDKRFETLNGKVASHEKFINEHVGRTSILGVIGGVVSSLVVIIAGKFLGKLF